MASSKLGDFSKNLLQRRYDGAINSAIAEVAEVTLWAYELRVAHFSIFIYVLE